MAENWEGQLESVLNDSISIDGAIKNFVDWVYRRRNCKKLKRPATKSTLPVFLKRPKGSLT